MVGLARKRAGWLGLAQVQGAFYFLVRTEATFFSLCSHSQSVSHRIPQPPKLCVLNKTVKAPRPRPCHAVRESTRSSGEPVSAAPLWILYARSLVIRLISHFIIMYLCYVLYYVPCTRSLQGGTALYVLLANWLGITARPRVA